VSSPLVNALLIEAPVNRHFAQLHRDPQALTDAVTLYLETGLRRGNGVVVIASPSHTDLFLNQLRAHELEPRLFLKSGQLELHDAELMLRKFLRNDMPDWDDFRRALGAVFERVRAFGRGTTRAYGEMVNVLWQEGKQDAAIRLEEYWNELARLYPFSLFCSYMLDVHQDQSYSGPLEEIGRTHSDIVGTDGGVLPAQSRRRAAVPEWPADDVVKRNLPSASAAVLERARRYYEESLQ
jgi:hypothetical protein